MSRPKPKAPSKTDWRSTTNAPVATRADKYAPVMHKPRKNLPEVSYGNWVTSSYDLLDGVEVTEIPDTIPAELFDELFVHRQDTPKSPGK